MGTSPIFTGSSNFSVDFQNLVTRSVAIASLPINALNGDRAGLQGEVKALGSLESAFTALQTALQGIEGAVSGLGFESTVSNPEVATVILGLGAQEGNYSIEVLDAGSYASSLSSAAWVAAENPPGTQRTYQLSVGTDEYDVTPSDNTATSVAAAINAKAGDKVRATVVNVGSSDTPDYRISLRSVALGDMVVDVKWNSSSLQTQSDPPGRLASYEVNNSGLTVTSDSRMVEIAEGLNVSLLSSDVGHPVDISVTRSTAALSSALTRFASAYNAAADALDAQRGQAGGALSGQSLLYDLGQQLRNLAGYASGEGAINGLPALGLEVGKDGKMTFTSSKLTTADMTSPAAITAFLGNASFGGFLKAATDALSAATDPSTGIIETAQTSVASELQRLDARIADKQEQVDRLQERLLEQMAAADAAIAAMEQQYSYISSMFSAMETASKSYQ
jgi:flagellar hook-associated protein 2